MIEQEKLLFEHPIPITYEETKIITEQMEKNICGITLNDGKKGTGFFCKIPFTTKYRLLPVLITNWHVIKEEILYKDNQEITIFIKTEKRARMLNLNNRLKYTNSKLDITIIELKEKEDKIYDYLELSQNIIEEGSNNIYAGKTIYIVQYPEEKLSVSYGILKEIQTYQFSHLCSSKCGSSGSPILSLDEKKVIGIHIGNHKVDNYNIGTFLNYPIQQFIQKNKELLLKEFNQKFKMNIKDINTEKLDLYWKNIGNEGLNYLSKINFKELKVLNLHLNRISDIKSLTDVKLDKLEELDLSFNEIANIKVLENVNFKELKNLNLADNNIKDLGGLRLNN